MVMMRQKIITALIGLMCFSLIGESFTVICHGADGHKAIEFVLHNHCNCPKPDVSDQKRDTEDSHFFLLTDHHHCKDTPAASIFSISVRKNNKPQIGKIPAESLYQNETSDYMLSCFRCTVSRNNDLSSFFTPLQSIILLA